MSKWACTIVKEFEGTYYARMCIDGKEVEDLPEGVNYKTLKEAIKNKTGITILKHKEMIFEKLSDTEKIATIDATQYRGIGKDCRVTLKERIEGWKPNFAECNQ
jgi:hypothetical protein